MDTNAVLVGVQGSSFPIDPVAGPFINDALTSALAALPSAGGDLYVLPGTQPYAFRGTVTVDKPNVTLHFSRGAKLVFGVPLQALVHVQSERFRCIGARVDQVVTASQSGSSCFLLDSTGGANSDEATFSECLFRVQQSAPDIVGFACIRALGAPPPESPRRGLFVADCAFELVEPGVQQTTAFTGSDPHGVCMIRSSDSADTIIRANHFRGSAATAQLQGGPVIFARESPSVVVSDNVFRDLVAVPLSGSQALVDIAGSTVSADLDVVLARNVVESANADAVVRIEGGRGLVMTAFNIGRMFGGTRAGLLLVPSHNGQPVSNAAVYGGNLHNVNRVDGHMIRAEAARSLSISGNAFSIIGANQEFLSFVPGACDEVVIAPRQPRERKT